MSGKAVARAGKSIDWDHLSKVVVSDAGKRDLAALRRAYDDVAATLNEKFSVKPSSINWEFYKHKLGPSVVNIFQQSYGALDKDVPDYQDGLTPVYETKHWELLNKALAEEEDSKRKIVMLEKEIDNVREQKAALSTMTVDDYFAKHPEVKDKIDDEITHHNWGYKMRNPSFGLEASALLLCILFFFDFCFSLPLPRHY
jgi:F-type H+-transporting ATPase subunit d